MANYRVMFITVWMITLNLQGMAHCSCHSKVHPQIDHLNYFPSTLFVCCGEKLLATGNLIAAVITSYYHGVKHCSVMHVCKVIFGVGTVMWLR